MGKREREIRAGATMAVVLLFLFSIVAPFTSGFDPVALLAMWIGWFLLFGLLIFLSRAKLPWRDDPAQRPIADSRAARILLSIRVGACVMFIQLFSIGAVFAVITGSPWAIVIGTFLSVGAVATMLGLWLWSPKRMQKLGMHW